MKKAFNILSAVFCICLLFSLFAGCKLKQKLSTKTVTSQESTLAKTAKATSSTVDSTSKLKVDTSKSKSVEADKSTQKRTIELTIELDSNKQFPPDSSGTCGLKSLVNSALKNAKSLKLRIEEQQSHESNKTSSTDLHKSDQESAVKKEQAASDSTIVAASKGKRNDQHTETTKDSTVKSNTGLSIWLFALQLVTVCAIHGLMPLYKYLKNKRALLNE